MAALLEPDLESPLSYQPAEGQLCDIVMKGGITSGVVYPHAVCQLATHYRFKNVGGTSAGAIAAALTAAAELGRYRDLQAGERLHSFVRLARLPSELGQDVDTPTGKRSRLVSLFQPQVGTRLAYELLLASLSPGNKILNLLKAAIGQAPLAAALGFGAGLILIEVLAEARNPFFGPVVAFLTGVLGAVIGVLVAVVVEMLRSLPTNAYGICAGTETVPGQGPPALSTWLADLLDELAGNRDKPLTFGDLKEAGIDLRLMTSCVSQGKPYTLPFEAEVANYFYFNPDDLRHHLPERVLKHMTALARQSQTLSELRQSGRLKELGLEGLYPLPLREDFPVIAAVRMSLSFPILLSAVPLYSIDFTRKDEQDWVPARCWFSDGGLSSNFPLHFFDAPFPSHPTFALNLRPFHRDFPRKADESENVSSPLTLRQGREATWRYFEVGDKPASGFGRIAAFMGALFDLTQNWSDNTLLELPGHRERVAHVYLEGKEGGLNLVMGPKTIARLALRGRYAAMLLMDKFVRPPSRAIETEFESYRVEQEPTKIASRGAEPEAIPRAEPKLDWDDHRYIRLHSTLAVLRRYLEQLHHNYQAHGAEMEELLERKLKRHNQTEREQIKQELNKIAELAERWQTERQLFEKNEPLPRPELRSRPKL